MFRALVLALSGLLLPTAVGQDIRDSNPEYEVLKALLRKDVASAEKALDRLDRRVVGAAEIDYLRALVAMAAKRRSEAVRAVLRAVKAGLPAERILAGPSSLTAGLALDSDLGHLREGLSGHLVHGPTLGNLGPQNVSVWVRTRQPATVKIVATPKVGKAIEAVAKTDAGRDHTSTLRLSGLTPETEYVYTVAIDDGPAHPGGSFRTTPELDDVGEVTLAFHGGAASILRRARMWASIQKRAPEHLLLLGNTVAPAAPEFVALQRFSYYRGQSVPEFRRLTRTTPVYAIWNDLDFGTPGCMPGADPDKPAWKRDVHRVFTQNWPNPKFGKASSRGCFFDFQLPGVHVFMLDGRQFRQDPAKHERPSMLGRTQMAWLTGELMMSQAPFKVICSPVPWSSAALGGAAETWSGYLGEREELFQFLGTAKVEGVLLLSSGGDGTQIWKIPRKNVADVKAYPMLELSSSWPRGSKAASKAEYSFRDKPSFGLVTFDTRKEDPTIRFRVVDIVGKLVHERIVERSEICYR